MKGGVPNNPVPWAHLCRSISTCVWSTRGNAGRQTFTLINNVIDKVWETEAERSLNADAILDQVRNHGALLIFDGLDEVLVHLDDQEGRDFVRQLWRALPPARSR